MMERLESLEERLANKDASLATSSVDSGYSPPASDENSLDYMQTFKAIAEQVADERMDRSRVEREQDEALKYIKSLKNVIQTDEDEEALIKIMEEYSLDFKKHPLKAVKAAIPIFKEAHGIQNNSSSAERKAAGIQGGSRASADAGERMYKLEDLAKMKPWELEKIWVDVQEAYKEGRIIK